MCSCQDRDSVADVVNRYAYALDNRQWTVLDDVFTTDAVARYGTPKSPQLNGRENIVASIRSFLDGCGPSQHLLGNHLIEINVTPPSPPARLASSIMARVSEPH